MNPAHLDDEINQFASFSFAPYAPSCNHFAPPLFRTGDILAGNEDMNLSAILNYRSTKPTLLARAILAAKRWVVGASRFPEFEEVMRIESVRVSAYSVSRTCSPETCRMGILNLMAKEALKPLDRERVRGFGATSVAKTLAGGSGFSVLALALLLLTPPAIPDKPDVVSVPFRTAQSMILVDARVNGKSVTLLLDTGAVNTIISAKACGIPQFQLQGLHRKDHEPGLTGDSLRLRANFAFANRVWLSQPVSVMNVDELTRRFGTPVDGVLGQDLLREFRSVRINYKSHVIELEQ
jgi:Aspartyl protease